MEHQADVTTIEMSEATLHAELIERIAGAVPQDGAATPLPGVILRRASAPTAVSFGVSEPSFCVIAQGSKVVQLGEDRFPYDPAHYLIATVELPVVSQITTATPEAPYLSFRLDLDPAVVGSVLVEAGDPAISRPGDARAIAVSRLDGDLLCAVIRLLRLIDTPADTRFLGPLISREIVYRLLRGGQGGRLFHLAGVGGATQRIAPALERMRRQFDRPLKVEEMARELRMSVSSFHHHFKAVTAMSPLQFQKQLRLQEARRLMLGEGYDATTAGLRVGYGEPSHFNRDYKRLFGEPPMRDVTRLRESPVPSTGV